MEKKQDVLDKLNRLLEVDADFKKKFESVFDTQEKLTLQIAAAEAAETKGGCHCYPYLCGKGCFASYPGARGHVVG